MDVNGGVLPQYNGNPIFPGSHAAGPLLAGHIRHSSSLAPGGQPPQPAGLGGTIGLANVGFATMSQTAVVTQAAAPGVPTPIVLPAQSQILRCTMMVTTAFSGTATTASIGITGGTGADLVALTSLAALGQTAMSPGTTPATIAKWDNVGNADVQITVVSANAGAGVGTLTVEYVQGINNAS